MTVPPARRREERRRFMIHVLAASAAVACGANRAIAADRLDPADPYARSLDFRLRTEEVDPAKYPKHTAEQRCQTCRLWDGGDKDSGSCSYFDGAITPKTAWCRSYRARKPAAL